MTQIVVEKKRLDTVRTYLSLTKPGIVMGNMISAFAGYLLASTGLYMLSSFVCFSMGLSLVIASGCVFNNCLDVELDEKMFRTKTRALPSAKVEKKAAFFFGLFLSCLGALFLGMVNGVALGLAFLGLFSYVAVYSFFKYVSPYATLVGAVPGAIPPLVGYAAVKPTVDGTFVLLFLLLSFWQIPHFYAISLFRLEEFRKAKLPVFPIKKGIFRTKVHMALFACAFVVNIFFLGFSFRCPRAFLVVMGPLSLFWMGQCALGFWRKDLETWARSVFGFSIVLMMAFAISCLGFA